MRMRSWTMLWQGNIPITVPTVIIQGEEDFAVEPMLAELPACTLKMLPGVCHFPPTEAPVEVKRVVDEFFGYLK